METIQKGDCIILKFSSFVNFPLNHKDLFLQSHYITARRKQRWADQTKDHLSEEA